MESFHSRRGSTLSNETRRAWLARKERRTSTIDQDQECTRQPFFLKISWKSQSGITTLLFTDSNRYCSRPVTCQRTYLRQFETYHLQESQHLVLAYWVEWSLCPKLLSFTNAARLLFLFQLFPLIVTQDAFLAQTGEFFVLPILGELMTLMLQDQEFSQPKLLEAAPSHESLLSARTAFAPLL